MASIKFGGANGGPGLGQNAAPLAGAANESIERNDKMAVRDRPAVVTGAFPGIDLARSYPQTRTAGQTIS